MAKQTKKTKAPVAQQQFLYINISDIIVDADQPRKYFNETDLQELAASIKQSGVLQPILVRPYNGQYLLVFGERRYRASKIAGVDTIPANVRDLSDDEAFEIQIMENLQRKDVEPIEEADAFQKLIDKGMDIESIALKVGKNPKYVVQRLLLNNLIDAYKDLLHKKQMTLKYAYKIAVLGTQSQEDVLNGSNYPKEGITSDDYQFHVAANYLRNQEHLLSKATWQLDDVFIHPEAGACSSCQYNTACQSLLFPDSEAKCLNTSCFLEKGRLTWLQKIEELSSEPNILFVSTGWYLNEQSKQKIKMVEKLGSEVIDIYHTDKYKIIDAPEPLEAFDEWADYNDGLVDVDRDDSPEKWSTAMTIEYQKAIKEYDNEFEKYLIEVKEKKAIKAYDITDINLSVVYLISRGQNTEAKSEQENNKEAIDKIREKESRAESLDRDKIYKELVKKLTTNDGLMKNKADLSPLDQIAICYTLYMNLPYGTNKKIAEMFGLKEERYHNDNYELISKLKLKDLQSLQNILCRQFTFHKLVKPESAEADWMKNESDKVIYDLADHYIQNDLLDIQSTQYAIREKRKEKVEQKIKSLQS